MNQFSGDITQTKLLQVFASLDDPHQYQLSDTDTDKAMVWLYAYLDSHINDLRLSGKFQTADRLRKAVNIIFRTNFKQQSISVLKEFVEGYRKHRNMPNATLTELEME